MSVLATIGLNLKEAGSSITSKFNRSQTAYPAAAPLGVRPGSVIQFCNIQHRLDDSLHVEISRGLLEIEAVGFVNVASDEYVTCWCYAKTGEMLELIAAKADLETVIECRCFQLFDEVFPETADEWDFWIGDQQPLLGSVDFIIDELQTCYPRLWPEGDEITSPVELEENIFTQEEDEGVLVNHICMRFGALLESGLNEYVHATAINKRSSQHIAILLGADIDPSTVTVAYLD